MVPCSNFAFGLIFIIMTQQLSRFFRRVFFSCGARESSKMRVSLLLRNIGRCCFFVDDDEDDVVVLASERKHSFKASSDLLIASVFGLRFATTSVVVVGSR